MSLIENLMVDCILMDKVRTPDGEGGYITEWIDGAPIKAAISLDTTIDARIAEKQGVTNVYTITVSKGINLEYHDVIKRVSDGSTFRIASNSADKETPTISSLNIAQATAEKWSLTS